MIRRPRPRRPLRAGGRLDSHERTERHPAECRKVGELERAAAESTRAETPGSVVCARCGNRYAPRDRCAAAERERHAGVGPAMRPEARADREDARMKDAYGRGRRRFEARPDGALATAGGRCGGLGWGRGGGDEASLMVFARCSALGRARSR